MPKETGEKLIVQNKKARHDYAIEDKYEAGLALTGTEVKSLREGRASLSEAFISIDEVQSRAKVSSAVIDVLKSAGALQGLPDSSQTSLF